ncbi:D-2-hydroxyglutarate dehydrogenase [hydrothermal vent metagenome]|uniref:D-2-hydroxyglutarate dehydrogenase n=1 Tax=hydrothermal vent metagenome TaxID=652676 RepID=A0A3B0USY2_9ZZZZ
MAPYIVELRGRFHTPALAIAIPKTIEQLQKLVSWANDYKIGLVPQGGNTGMVGGQVPKQGNEIIVSMAKLNQIRHVDANGGYMCVEAGVTLQSAQKAADEAGLLFPLAIAPQEKAQIGGILSSNAGGLQVLAYGYARQLCLGIEAVMANGSLYQGLSGLKKDNTGYDLSSLMVGAEGTLGIISAATLKLFPKPKGFETAFINLSSPEAALALYSELIKRLGTSLTTFEMMPDFGMQMQIRHKMIDNNPAGTVSDWYVLAQMSQLPGQSSNSLSNALDSSLKDGVIEQITIAKDEETRRQMWRVREQLSGAQSKEGASIKHDISVPVSAVPELIESGIEAAKKILPDIRPCPFGHLGDGNIHFNFSQPVGADPKAYMEGADKIHEAIYEIVTNLGGSISAEHGIGQLKTQLLKQHKDPVAYELMKKIKLTFDPNNIMNPGKMFD